MAENFNTNLLNVAACYVKRLRIPITNTTLKQNLKENPYYPSLYALNNVFERFNIEHTASKVEKENFENLTAPFVAYLKNQSTGKDFVLVTSITENEVHYIAENKKVKKVTKEDFLKDWENIILQANPDANSGEKDYQLNRKKEIAATNKTYSFIAASVLIFFSTVYFFLHSLQGNFIMTAAVLLLIKMLGLAVTILLLVYEIDKSNGFVKNICTAGKQSNCGAVLQSKASKIFGMSWSEVGFFYFASTFLFLLFPSVTFANKIALLSIASCLAAPYILFSIYYQWKVVKQWCPLCLTVQAVLAMELIWSIVNFWQHPFLLTTGGYWNILLITGYCLLISLTAWYILKPLILKAKNESVYNAAYKRLLYNPETFNHLLQQQQPAPDGYQNIGITIGNPDAANTIIKVCNPYCWPCAKVHPVLDEIIHNNKNVKLKLIFTASNDANDIRGIIAKHLLDINAMKNPLQTQQALDDWYLTDKKDYELFAAKYPLNSQLKKQEKQIDEMKDWCREANIRATPTLFVNGRKLPESYSVKELKYIL
ncbi:MAG: vitamin K epoxide reductase family protein [Ginsengibacter sp.]